MNKFYCIAASKQHFLLRAGIGLSFLLFPSAAYAATCSITNSSIAFGTLNVLTGTSADATATFRISCSELIAITIPYEITLSTGVSGNYSTRKMASGANRLDYNIYVDPARTSIFGNGTNGTSTITGQFVLVLLNLNQSRDYTIYGRVNGNQQTAAAGAYSEALTMTVNY